MADFAEQHMELRQKIMDTNLIRLRNDVEFKTHELNEAIREYEECSGKKIAFDMDANGRLMTREDGAGGVQL